MFQWRSRTRSGRKAAWHRFATRHKTIRPTPRASVARGRKKSTRRCASPSPSLELDPQSARRGKSLRAVRDVAHPDPRGAGAALSAEGLVTSLPNRNTIVATIDFVRLPVYFEALSLMYRVTTRLAASNRKPEHLIPIRAWQAAFADAVDRQDALSMIASNRDFHVAIAEAGGNPYFTQLFTRLLDEGRRILRLYYSSFDDKLPRQYVEEHEPDREGRRGWRSGARRPALGRSCGADRAADPELHRTRPGQAPAPALNPVCCEKEPRRNNSLRGLTAAWSRARVRSDCGFCCHNTQRRSNSRRSTDDLQVGLGKCCGCTRVFGLVLRCRWPWCRRLTRKISTPHHGRTSSAAVSAIGPASKPGGRRCSSACSPTHPTSTWLSSMPRCPSRSETSRRRFRRSSVCWCSRPACRGCSWNSPCCTIASALEHGQVVLHHGAAATAGAR